MSDSFLMFKRCMEAQQVRGTHLKSETIEVTQPIWSTYDTRRCLPACQRYLVSVKDVVVMKNIDDTGFNILAAEFLELLSWEM